jgi:hypothetical protein
MTRGSVDEACTRIVSYMVAVQERHIEIIAMASKRMSAYEGAKNSGRYIA